MKLAIEIDVQNPEEVIKAHRGQIFGMLTDVVMSKEKMKYKVEKAIINEMIKELKIELPKVLREEYIDAYVDYQILDDPVI